MDSPNLKSFVPVDSLIIKESSSQKPTTTFLYSSDTNHFYNYWTLKERLRSRNEKLWKKQQSSCRLAFYSLWLFLFSGVLGISVYRFIDECTPTIDNRKQTSLKCLRNVLFLIVACINFLSCSGIVYGACQYFRSQPQSLSYNDEYELHLIHALPSLTNSCCYQRSSSKDNSVLPLRQLNNEHSHFRVNSLIQNTSSQRKIPPFTYDELPFIRTILPSSLLIFDRNVQSSNMNHNQNAFSFSSTSNLSTSAISYIPNLANSNNNKHKSRLIFEDTCLSKPHSHMPCLRETDIWKRYQQCSCHPAKL